MQIKPFLIIKYLLFSAWCWCFIPIMHAQHANVWAFGGKAGLDFNGSSPTAITTAMNTWEGCATVCDVQGQLLFYTDGSVIYNRSGLLMPGGALFGMIPTSPTISPTNSTVQAAAIASVPGSRDQYYVFSLSHSPMYGPYGLYYSIVDMTLNGGYGNVVTGKRLIPLDTGLTEKMTVVKSDNCNTWLVVHSRSANEWKAYELTDTGIRTTPVISALGSLPPVEYATGGIRFSPDRQKMVSYNLGNTVGGLELYDFDPQSGILSNVVLLSSGRYNAACFSPDNSKLYALPFPAPPTVRQYDLSLLPNVAAVILSDTPVYRGSSTTSGNWNDIQRGPDGKLYFISQSNNPGFVHAINFPNLRGSACQPVLNAVPLAAGTTCYLGLPNDNVVLPIPDSFRLERDTVTCAENAIIQADTTGNSYGHIWNDGTTGSRLPVTAPGSYTVRYWRGCTAYYTDIFHITFRYFALTDNASSSCPGMRQGDAWVEQQDNTPRTYTWTDTSGAVLQERQSNHGDTLTGLNPGTYLLYVADTFGCDTLLYIHVATKPAPSADFITDTVVCLHQPVNFINMSDATVWSWDLGDGTTTDTLHPQHTYTHTGIYEVVLAVENQAGCRDTNRQLIRVKDFILQLTADDTLVHRNTTVLLSTSAGEPYTVIAWEPANIFHDQQAYRQHVVVDSNMRYMAVAQSSHGCIDSAVIHVSVMGDIFLPSVFSPNGDGRNDFFRPVRTAYGIPVMIRQLQVYNRWGALIWSATGKKAEQGWDGYHKGTPAETGVYFWLADFETADGKTAIQKGEVTLVR